MSKLPSYYYNASKETFERAKNLRKNITKAEKILWHELRRNNLKKYHFRRQHPIAWYIADFYCHTAKLVIELDGEVHELEEMKAHDEWRDGIMENFDIKVLRFKNEDVFGNIDWVVKEIKKHLT
jgi:cyclase